MLYATQMIDDEKTAQDILAYLREHPGAGDTVEGISRWWVLRQRINESVDAVRLALGQLEKEGLVCPRKMADGQTVYFADAQAGNPQSVENEGATETPEEDESV
jgi:hypothetical protein